MKRTVLSLLVSLFISLGVSAYSFKVDNIAYNILSSSTVEVTQGGDYDDANNPNIVIPAKVVYNNVEYAVVRIGDNAFNRCPSYLKSVVIPEGVTSIGCYAFYDCYKMESISLPSTLKSIDYRAFMYNFSLNNVVIPDGVTEIKESTFYGLRDKLTDITLPNGLKSIGEKAFGSCNQLEFLQIPESVVSIGNEAFYSCSKLKGISIPENIQEIGSNIFNGCNNIRYTIENGMKYYDVLLMDVGDKTLSSYTIKEGTKYIGTAFQGCSNMESITIPSSVVSVEGEAFLNCNRLPVEDGIRYADTYLLEVVDKSRESYTIKNKTRWIADEAFSGCSSVKTITIPNGVKKIGYGSFEDCISLASVYLPDNIVNIGDRAFFNCTSLTTVELNEGLESIGASAFSGCSLVKTITIPNGVKKIESGTFEDCISLTSISLPNDIVEIDNRAFFNCTSLISVELNEGLVSIGASAFYNCTSLESITIPSSVTVIGYNGYLPTFGNCISLKKVIINNPVIADNYFHYFRDGYVESDETYWEMATGGKYYLKNYRFVKPSIVIFPEGTTQIESQSFIDVDDLKSFVIPSTVTKIGDNAFYGCSSLANIRIPDGVTSIGNAAFYYCSLLESLIIPDGVTTIGQSAFKGCSLITSLIIPEGVSNIREWTFQDTKSLVSLTIPSTFTSLNDKCFYGTGNDFKFLTIAGNEMADYELYKKIDNLDKVIIFVDEGLYSKYANDPGWSSLSKHIVSADMLEQKTVQLTAKEDHSALFSELGNNSIYVANLKIKGTINGYDIMSLRNKTLHLLYLDLSEADIVANDGGYEYYTGCSLQNDNDLGNHSFAGSLLREVILPKSLKTVGREAFYGCEFLEKVVIPDGVESIGRSCFANSLLLKDVNLPQTLTFIDEYAFQYCKLGSMVVIPDNVTTVRNHSFERCKIDSLVIGKNVTYIENDAFRDCENLSKISFNRKLTRLGAHAFYNCQKLVDVALPYTVEQIDNYAFEKCAGLLSIKIPSMTKTIGEKAFYGCNNIKNVYTYTVEPTAINQNTFSCYTTAMLNVPKTSAYLYIYDTKWSQFLFVQEFDEPYDAFYLNGDVELNDSTGRMSGEPDAEMYATSGFIIDGNDVQELSDIELSHDGTNGASIIGASGDVTGNQVNLTAKSMKVNIGVDGNRWYFFCFPFDVARDSVECTTDYVFYSYDGSKRAKNDSGWTKMESDFGSLQKGVGYIFQTSRTGILTIHVGAEYLSFTANNEKDALHAYESTNASNASWNFIGNPFISYYDVQDLAKEYDAPIVVWNGSGYDAYKPGDDDYQLRPFEAFFVQKETGSSFVEFLPENRMTYNQATTRSSLRASMRAAVGTPMNLDRQLVNIVLMGQDSITDRTRIVYSVNASMDYEIGVDAAKFHADGVPQIYTLNGTTKYAINERPMGGDEIKLGYVAPKAGSYTLSVPRHDADVEIYDNVTNSKVDFTFGDYTFQSKAGTYNDRFVVRKASGGVTAVENGFRLDGMTVTAVNGGIEIEGRMAGKVSVYNEAGMFLAELTQTGRLELGMGVYIVKIGERSVKMCVY